MLTNRQLAESSLSQGTPVTSWSFEEERIDPGIDALKPYANALQVGIPYDLPYRRIYWHVEPAFLVANVDTPPDYYVNAEWRLQRNGRDLAILPASIGVDNSMAYVNVCKCKIGTASAGVVTSEAVELALSMRFKSLTRRVSLSPYRITCQADAIRLSIGESAASGDTIKGLKVWVGVLSSNQPI